MLLLARPSLAKAPTPELKPIISPVAFVSEIDSPIITLRAISRPDAVLSVTERPSVDKEVIKDYIRQVFGVHGQNAIKIANCESGINPYSLNNNPSTGDYSVGIFQINLYGSLAKNRPSEAWLKDYKNNVDYAHQIFLASGWGAWSCS